MFVRGAEWEQQGKVNPAEALELLQQITTFDGLRDFPVELQVKCRASVSGRMLDTKATRGFLRNVNLKGMIASHFKFSPSPTFLATYLLPPHSLESIARTPRTCMERWDWKNKGKCIFLCIFYQYRQSQKDAKNIEHLLLTKCVAVEIIDPDFDVPAADSLSTSHHTDRAAGAIAMGLEAHVLPVQTQC